MGRKSVAVIDSADVLRCLTPIWTEKPETADRVRQRIGSVMKWAIGQNWRTDNPAATIQSALPKRNTRPEHHRALPYAEAAGAIERVRSSQASPVTKLALEWLVLTAARSSEVRLATWDEIDGDVWTIPADRMKTKRAHRVPLSDRCVAILKEAKQYRDRSGLLFPGFRQGRPLSDVTLTKLLRELGIDSTAHGFRSSFRQWAAEKTNIAREVCEFALAHVVGDAAERAYQRSDLFDKRRLLMQQWADYLAVKSADVIPMRRG